MAQSYSTRPVEAVSAAELVKGWDGQALAIGVDVSKADLRLVPRWADGTFLRPIRVRQPSQIGQGIELLRSLGAGRDMIVALEPTGRYGDVFRQACHRAGITVHRVSAKVSHDYAEVFDGVPSQHDGKDAALIAELAAIGKSRPWPWPAADDWEQRLSLAADLGDAYQRQMIAWFNRLEAWLAAHPDEGARFDARPVDPILAHAGTVGRSPPARHRGLRGSQPAHVVVHESCASSSLDAWTVRISARIGRKSAHRPHGAADSAQAHRRSR